MDSEQAYSLFAQAVLESGLTVVDEGFFKFSPHGFTCFLLLSESHASLHAWPEYDYCAIDLFTCAIGKDMLPLIQRSQAAGGQPVAAGDVKISASQLNIEQRSECQPAQDVQDVYKKPNTFLWTSPRNLASTTRSGEKSCIDEEDRLTICLFFKSCLC